VGAGDRGAAGPQGRVVRWLDGATLDGILDRVASPHDGARVVARAWAADAFARGPSPSWYKSEAYRARVVRWPREVLAELGLQLDPETNIEVWDSSAETRYLVLRAARPARRDAPRTSSRRSSPAPG